jgi:hypothetical protein
MGSLTGVSKWVFFSPVNLILSLWQCSMAMDVMALHMSFARASMLILRIVGTNLWMVISLMFFHIFDWWNKGSKHCWLLQNERHKNWSTTCINAFLKYWQATPQSILRCAMFMYQNLLHVAQRIFRPLVFLTPLGKSDRLIYKEILGVLGEPIVQWCEACDAILVISDMT